MADAYMLDTGVVLRWYVPQDGFEHALEVQKAFLEGHVRLETVDFLRCELGNALRKLAYLNRLITRDEYLAAVRSVDDLEIVIHDSDADALERAAALAADRNISFFDALFVDRSLEQGIPLLTSDGRLVRAVAGFAPIELLRGITT